jgi:hypothetical protein
LAADLTPLPSDSGGKMLDICWQTCVPEFFALAIIGLLHFIQFALHFFSVFPFIINLLPFFSILIFVKLHRVLPLASLSNFFCSSAFEMVQSQTIYSEVREYYSIKATGGNNSKKKNAAVCLNIHAVVD